MHEFDIIARGSFPLPVTGDVLEELAESFGERDATDLTVCAHRDGVLLMVGREAASIHEAIRTAIADVESAGLQVVRVELSRDAAVAL